MGRKNRSEEKREVILNAFEAVILREGFANASQRRIAQEAEMNQPMLHHYFGGSDEMLKALLERVTARYRKAMNTFTELAGEASLEQILSFLCSAEFHQVSMQNEVMFRVIGQAQHHETAMKLLSEVYRELLAEIETYLSRAGLKDVKGLSYTIMCLVVGHDWVKSLGFGQHRNELMSGVLTRLVEQS